MRIRGRITDAGGYEDFAEIKLSPQDLAKQLTVEEVKALAFSKIGGEKEYCECKEFLHLSRYKHKDGIDTEICGRCEKPLPQPKERIEPIDWTRDSKNMAGRVDNHLLELADKLNQLIQRENER